MKERIDLLTLAYICYLKDDYKDIIEESKKIKNSNINYIIVNFDYNIINEIEKNILNQKNTVYSNYIKFEIAKYILSLYLKNINIIYNILCIDKFEPEEYEKLQKEGVKVKIIDLKNYKC